MEYLPVDLDLLLHVSRDIVYPYFVGFTGTKVPWVNSIIKTIQSQLFVGATSVGRTEPLKMPSPAMATLRSNGRANKHGPWVNANQMYCIWLEQNMYATILLYSIDRILLMGFITFSHAPWITLKYFKYIYKEALTRNDPSKTWLRIYLTWPPWNHDQKTCHPDNCLQRLQSLCSYLALTRFLVLDQIDGEWWNTVTYYDIIHQYSEHFQTKAKPSCSSISAEKKHLHQTRKWSASPPGSDHSVSGASQHLWINNDKHVTKNMEHTMQGGGSSVPVQTFTTRMMMMMMMMLVVVVVMMMMVIMPTTTSYIMIRVITRLKNDQYDQDDQQEQTDQYDQKEHPSEEKSWAQHWWLFDW